MRGADFIAEFLAGKGIDHVFLLPGGGAMFLNDAIAKSPKLKGVPCHHEQSTTIAAEAYGRITGNIGVAMVTTGPGGTNAVTGVTGAWIESVPMLVLSGQVKRADLLKDSPVRQKGVQEVDIVRIVKSVTKYAVTIEKSEDLKYELEKALYLARTGRMGPVWLDIPLDIQAAPIDVSKLRSFPVPQENATSIDTGKVLALLSSAKRPLILAGHGVRLSGAAKEFRNLIELLGIPVVTTWNAMDLLPDSHKLNVGHPGVVALRAPNFAIQNCDLLICIGSRIDNIITAFNPQGFAREAKKIIVDIDPHEIQKHEMNIEMKLPVDAASFIKALKNESATSILPDFSAWSLKCQDWKKRYSCEKTHEDSEGVINHFQFVRALSEAIPPDTLISTGSSGLAIEVFYTLFKNKEGQRIFLTSGLGAMGYGLPAAIGACLARDSKKMIAIESDGSLQLNIQELATVRALNLPICLFIMNNNGYASIRNTQRNYFENRFIGTGPESDLWMPDLKKVALAYEIEFLRIENPSSLPELLKIALQKDGPLIVDVRLRENETLSPKVTAIPQADGSLTSMPLEDMSPLLSIEDLQAEMLLPLLEASYTARGLKP